MNLFNLIPYTQDIKSSTTRCFSHLIIICSSLINLNAQNPATLWVKSLGGSSVEYPNSIVTLINNHFLIAGSTSSFDNDVDTLNRGLQSCGWLIKFDIKGNIIWKKNYGGSGFDGFNSIYQCVDKGFILVGATNSKDGDLKNTTGKSGWVLKIDSLGIIQWSKTIGSFGEDNFLSVFQTKNEDYIVGCNSNRKDGDFNENAGDYDIWILKLNYKGDLIWKKRIGGSEFDFLKKITNIDDKTFVLVGSTESNDGDFSEEVTGDVTIKMDSSGKILWKRTPNGTKLLSREFHDVTMSGNNIVSVGMQIVGQLGSSTQYPYSWDFKVTKTDTSGNELWTKFYGGLQSDNANSVNSLPNGDLVVSGFTQSDNTGDVKNNHSLGNGTTDFWVVRIDSMGKLKNATCYGGLKNDEALTSAIDSKGNVIVAGFAESSNGTFSENKGSYDWAIVKLAYDLTSTVETTHGFVDITEYPNPLDNFLTIKISGGFEPSVRLSDITGRTLFYSEKIKTDTEIDLSRYTSGMYFITYQVENELLTKKIIKL